MRSWTLQTERKHALRALKRRMRGAAIVVDPNRKAILMALAMACAVVFIAEYAQVKIARKEHIAMASADLMLAIGNGHLLTLVAPLFTTILTLACLPKRANELVRIGGSAETAASRGVDSLVCSLLAALTLTGISLLCGMELTGRLSALSDERGLLFDSTGCTIDIPAAFALLSVIARFLLAGLCSGLVSTGVGNVAMSLSGSPVIMMLFATATLISNDALQDPLMLNCATFEQLLQPWAPLRSIAAGIVGLTASVFSAKVTKLDSFHP